MAVSTVTRRLVVLLSVVALGVLVLATLAWWSFERTYGGQEQVRGVAIGLLADGRAEVREVGWGATDPESPVDYEVADSGGTVVVRYLDRAGEPLFSGTAEEVAAWLDGQGPQLFLGTYAAAQEYRADRQDSGKQGFPVWLVPIWFVPILTAIIAARREESPAGGAA